RLITSLSTRIQRLFPTRHSRQGDEPSLDQKSIQTYFKKILPPLAIPWFLLFIPALIYSFIRFSYLNIGARENWIYGKLYYTLIVMIPAVAMQLQEFVWPFPLNVNHTILDGYNALLYHEINLENPPVKPSLLDTKVIISIAILVFLAYVF